MRYKLHDGLVIESICGTPLLVSTLSARKECPYITELNESSLLVLKLLKEGTDTDEMKRIIAEKYKISEEEVSVSLKNCIDTLLNNHFIIPIRT